jgi:hypothetical protein
MRPTMEKEILLQLGWTEELISAFSDSSLDAEVREQLLVDALAPGTTDSQDLVVPETTSTSTGAFLIIH